MNETTLARAFDKAASISRDKSKVDALREQLAADTDAFLKAGGQIEKVDPVDQQRKGA